MCKNVLDYLDGSAEAYSDKTALCDEHRELTYGGWKNASQILGYEIMRRVRGIHQPVAVFMEKSVECLIAFMGVLYSGNYYVCIDPEMPPERVKKIFAALKPVLIIAGSGKMPAETPVPVMLCEDLPDRYPAGLDAGKTAELERIRKQIIETDPVYVLYTSGSTGIPKGSVISHHSVIAYTEFITETFHINPETVFGSQAPFYFSMSVLDIFSTVRNGATLQIIPGKLFSFPIALLEFLNQKKINTIYWVPSAFSIVAKWEALEYVELPFLKTILFAGEVMHTRILNVWRKHVPDALYANLFGPTEITDTALYYIVDREFGDDEPLPVGKCCADMDAFALGENGSVIKDGETGELYFRGSFVGMGYFADWERTAEAFVQNPLNRNYPETVYRTGDLVRLNEQGEYLYVGRRDSQIKRMGCRIELGEIETAVSSNGNIYANACIYNHETDCLTLFYQGNIAEDGLLLYLDACLPGYMRPDRLVKVDAMPYNANGKIDRLKLAGMERAK